MPKSFRDPLVFWLPIVALALLTGYAANALITVILMVIAGFVPLPSWLTEQGGLIALALAAIASLIGLARLPAATTRYRRGLALAGWLFLLVIPPFLTLLFIDGTEKNPGADGVAGAVVLMTAVVTVLYGLLGGGLLLASRLIARRRPAAAQTHPTA